MELQEALATQRAHSAALEKEKADGEVVSGGSCSLCQPLATALHASQCELEQARAMLVEWDAEAQRWDQEQVARSLI